MSDKPDLGEPKVALTPMPLEISPSPNTPALIHRQYCRMERVMLAVKKEQGKPKPDLKRVASLDAELMRRSAQLVALKMKVPRTPAEAAIEAATVIEKMRR